jgi:hypothetical protein
VDELSPAVKSRVHHNGHKIVGQGDLFEYLFKEGIPITSNLTDLLLEPFLVLSRLVKVLRLIILEVLILVI